MGLLVLTSNSVDETQEPGAFGRDSLRQAGVGVDRQPGRHSGRWLGRAAAVGAGLAELAQALARGGEHDRAEQVARAIGDPDHRARALAGVAAAVVEVGEPERARALAGEAERLARSVADEDFHPQSWADVVVAWAHVGEPGRAEQLAQAVTDPHQRVRVLVALVTALTRVGDLTRARVLAAEVQRIADTMIDDPEVRAWVLAELVTVWAKTGQHAWAEKVASMTAQPDVQARAWLQLATALAQTGEHDQARKLLAYALGTADWHELPLTPRSPWAVDVLRALADGLLASPLRPDGASPG